MPGTLGVREERRRLYLGRVRTPRAGPLTVFGSRGVGGSNPLTPTTPLPFRGGLPATPRLDPDDRDSTRGQPTADLRPGFGLAPLPRVHAALRHHELRVAVVRGRLHEPGEVGARSSEL